MEATEPLSTQDLLSLLECARQFATEINHDRLVRTILDRACDMTDSPDGSVLLYDAERGGNGASLQTNGSPLREAKQVRHSLRVKPSSSNGSMMMISTLKVSTNKPIRLPSQWFASPCEWKAEV